MPELYRGIEFKQLGLEVAYAVSAGAALMEADNPKASKGIAEAHAARVNEYRKHLTAQQPSFDHGTSCGYSLLAKDGKNLILRLDPTGLDRDWKPMDRTKKTTWRLTAANRLPGNSSSTDFDARVVVWLAPAHEKPARMGRC